MPRPRGGAALRADARGQRHRGVDDLSALHALARQALVSVPGLVSATFAGSPARVPEQATRRSRNPVEVSYAPEIAQVRAAAVVQETWTRRAEPAVESPDGAMHNPEFTVMEPLDVLSTSLVATSGELSGEESGIRYTVTSTLPLFASHDAVDSRTPGSRRPRRRGR